MADGRAPQQLKQLRITDAGGQPLPSMGQYPWRHLPPSHYAVPSSTYAGAPVNVGLQPDEMSIFGSILQGGIGAPHAPTQQQLLMQGIQDYMTKIGEQRKQYWQDRGK